MNIYYRGYNVLPGCSAEHIPILKTFTNLYVFDTIKEIYLNYSYYVIIANDTITVYLYEGTLNLNRDISSDISLVSCNDHGVIFVHKNEIYTVKLSNVPDIIKTDYGNFFAKTSIKNLACTSRLIIIYTTNGKLCKISNNVPVFLEFKHYKICDIKCGKEHCVLLDEDGNVYSFGNGSRGQLGHGKLDDESEPVLIEALAGLKITTIAAGGWHSCAISESGDLYSWGWNSNGQLGLGKEDGDDGFFSVMATPQVVDFCEDNLTALKVACGSRHTMVYLDNKKLYGCGWNKYHQLTEEIKENYFTFTYLHDLNSKRVVDIYCGPWTSAVVCD